MADDFVIGIDLGTTNTCVACFKNEELKVLENGEGDYTTPSFVLFAGPKEIVVGKNAMSAAATKPENGIYEIKRLIGRQYHEEELQQILKHLPYQVKQNEGNPVVFLEKYNTVATPVDICSNILKKVKTDVTNKLGKKVTKAVITVPAHFNVSQRKDTLKAAERAGFVVLKLLSEPSAAALNYFYEHRSDENVNQKYCLVYDLGGGTFDVAIVKCNKEEIAVIGVDGDSYLGGHDFDNLILNYAEEQLREKYKITKEHNKSSLRRLKNACKTAKEVLCTVKSTSIILEGFLGIEVVDIPLTRLKFDELAQDLFKKSIDVVDRCLKKSGLNKGDIDQIILAGGSTHIKKIKEMLQTYFEGKVLNQTLHPAHCVAMGAALQAAMLSKNPQQKIKQFHITEVTPSSLGVADLVQRMDFIIKKDTQIPTSGSITHGNVRNNQDSIYFTVFEGERLDVRKNICLGVLKVTNLTPAPPQECKITVTMSIDNNGILTVTAKEKHKNNVKDLEIALLPDYQQRIVTNQSTADEEAEDRLFDKFANIKQFLILFCEAVSFNLTKLNLLESHKLTHQKCLKAEQDIVQMDVNDKDKLISLGREIVKICEPLVSKHNFKNMPSWDSSVKRELIKTSTSNSTALNAESIVYGHVRITEKKSILKK